MNVTKGNPLADIERTSIIFKYAFIPEDKSFIEINTRIQNDL